MRLIKLQPPAQARTTMLKRASELPRMSTERTTEAQLLFLTFRRGVPTGMGRTIP